METEIENKVNLDNETLATIGLLTLLYFTDKDKVLKKVGVVFTSYCIDGWECLLCLVPFESLDHLDSNGVSKHIYIYLYDCMVLPK